MKLRIFLFLLALNGMGWEAAAQSTLCQERELGKQPILAEGRVIPLFSHANRIRSTLFPKKTCLRLSATELYCSLSFFGLEEAERACGETIMLKVEHVQSKKILGLAENARSASPGEIGKNREKLTAAYHEQKEMGAENGGYAQDLASVLLRLQKLESILEGKDWKVLTGTSEWLGLNQVLSSRQLTSPQEESAARALLYGSASRLTSLEKRNLKLETLYERFKPFSTAVLVSLLGFLFSILSLKSARWTTWAEVALGLVLLLEVGGITLRVLISGRAPVTNMYETVMWAGLGAFTLSAILGFKFKNRRIWAAGFAGNSICLLMMTFATNMLDGTIQPLVPVLRDNFWLSTHVTSITLSYSCFFLSWIIANFVMFRFIFSKKRTKVLTSIQSWNYITRVSIQVGVVLLAAGVLLGGVWADYSWGRFWGWDPKETWSLIALIVYVSILHGKYVGWFKDMGFAVMAGFGFLFILMAWFGVNYILATGLHSYGFSSGGSLFLLSIFLAQLAVLGTTLLLYVRLGPKAERGK